MNCRDFQEQTRDWSVRGRIPDEAARHAAGCPECAQWWKQEQILTDALAAIAESAGGDEPGPRVELALLSAFRAQNRRNRIRRYGPWAVAAAVVIAMVPLVTYPRKRTPEPPMAHTQTAGESPFYAIGPGAGIDGFAPVIRMRLPRRELRRIGLAAWGPESGETTNLEVDVLVGRDGVAKAVRLVRDREGYSQGKGE